MRKASTRMLEQGIQAPSPAPDLIPAEHQSRTYIQIGTMNGGTSEGRNECLVTEGQLDKRVPGIHTSVTIGLWASNRGLVAAIKAVVFLVLASRVRSMAPVISL